MRAVFIGLLFGVAGVLARKCGVGIGKCPRSSPCCSSDGFCGGGAEQCTSGCQPLFSLSPSSCIPNAICEPTDFQVKPDMFNHSETFRPLLQFNGDPTQSRFVFEQGYLGRGKDGVLLEMSASHNSRVSSSRYLLYGQVSAKLRHDPSSGFVTTFGTASDVGDAILFRLGGPSSSRITTDYAVMNTPAQDIGTQKYINNFDVAKWHNYTIDWTPDKIDWRVDGQSIRRVHRKKAGNKFPVSPSRVLLTAYGVGADDSTKEKHWANGTLSIQDDGYKKRGYYAHEFGYLSISCADPNVANASVSGVGNKPVAYIYTGRRDNQTNRPEFSLSRDQIRALQDPAKDGPLGTPGKPGMSPYGPKPNMYTGGSGNLSTTSSTTGADSNDTVSNGVKIGVPVGIGGAVLLGACTLLLFYFLRRRSRAKRRPPSIVSEPEPMQEARVVSPASPQVAPVFQQQHTDFMPVTLQQPYGVNTHSSVPPMEQAGEHDAASVPLQQDALSIQSMTCEKGNEHELDEAAFYYQDPFAAQPSYEVDGDSQSYVSDEKRHMHYAGHGAMRRFYPHLSEEENERLAAQDAWDELREAAIGVTDMPYFRGRRALSSEFGDDERSSDLFISPNRHSRRAQRSGRAHQRAAYSEGGALSPVMSSIPSFSTPSPRLKGW